MPRTLRQQSTARGAEALGVSSNVKAAGLGLRPASKGPLRKAEDARVNKTTADKDGKSMAQKRRAALGEITNVSNGKALAETTSQAKKGLSKMLNKSRSSLVRQASLRKAKSVEERPKTTLQAAATKRRPKAAESEPTSLIEEDLTLEFSGQTHSLPSSQEAIFEKYEDLTNDDESDSFQSAEEGNETEQHLRVPFTRTVPPNVIDFDALNADDPHQVSEYVNETFQYYKSREAQFRCPDYIRTVQSDITPSMRAILVDWLVEVQESFELNHETLYTAVKLLDLYLSKVRVKKEDLQLIGATACLISCKIDERLPPLLDDFVYVCDDAYRKDDIKRKEIEMIAAVSFDVGYPLTYRYLRRYGRVCQVTMPVLTFGRYILEMALMEYGLNVETSESRLAAAAIILTFKIKGIEGWEDTLRFYSGYSVDDCRDLAVKLHRMLLKAPHETRRTIRTKYEHEVFHNVAKIPIPIEISI